MKIKFWLTIFVLSFSLVAMAEGLPSQYSKPGFPTVEFSLESLKTSYPACFPQLENGSAAALTNEDLELSNLMAARAFSCPSIFLPRSVPVDFTPSKEKKFKVFDFITPRYSGDLVVSDMGAHRRRT